MARAWDIEAFTVGVVPTTTPPDPFSLIELDYVVPFELPAERTVVDGVVRC